MKWTHVKDGLPEIAEEVLVEVDGHRGPTWRNNHYLVAFRDRDGHFWEERHPSNQPLPVIKWARIEVED